MALSEMMEVEMGLGTLARKLPYSVAESWSFRSSTTQHELETTVAGSGRGEGGGKEGTIEYQGSRIESSWRSFGN